MKFKKHSGLTLIETLVAIAIFVIGVEGFSLLFARAWKSNSYTLEMGQASLIVSQGVGKMVNYIRGARQADNGSYPVQSANNNDLVLYSDYDKDGTTERIHFYKSGQNILMGVRNPTGGMPKTYPAGDQETISIANYIVNDADTPIFYYYNKDYPGDTAHNPLDTPATVADIRLVKIYLKINITPSRAPDDIEMQSFVEMRNLNDYDRIK
ncbi:MAG: prepilin-type N-terminal cleavage/methylation domain-containing protein [Candidatus Moranbacteria bacterium]|nr:prepilin-type N-terminal cleavage/methylation domain-containing protein [Candidatus Moranbacteria bacterium]